MDYQQNLTANKSDYIEGELSVEELRGLVVRLAQAGDLLSVNVAAELPVVLNRRIALLQVGL